MRLTPVVERPTEQHQRIVISIINARAKDGATTSEIRRKTGIKKKKKI